MSAHLRTSVGATAVTRDLWALAEIGDTSRLAPIIECGADINAINAAGVTALMRAAQRGNVAMVKALIQYGADLNASRYDRFTSLSLAVFFGHAEVVRLLVDSGARLDASTRFETSPQMWATARAYFDIADYLISAATRKTENEIIATPEVPSESQPNIHVEERVEIPQTSAVNVLNEVSLPRSVVVAALPTQHPVIEPPVIAPPEIDKTPLVISVRRSAPIETIQEIDVEAKPKSATPLVVRTLKDPPEIWDLVHETPPQFNPGKAFLTRLTSSSINLLLAASFLLAASGAGVYAFMKFRHTPAAAASVKAITAKQVQPPKVIAEPAKPREAPVTIPFDQQPVTQAEQSEVLADHADVSEPPTISLKRISSHEGKGRFGSAALRFAPTETSEAQNRAEGQNLDSMNPKPVTREETGPATQTRKLSPTLSPQLIAPSDTASPTKKAKVIQWP